MKTDEISAALKRSKAELESLKEILAEASWHQFKKKSTIKQRIAEEGAAIHMLHLMYYASLGIKL